MPNVVSAVLTFALRGSAKKSTGFSPEAGELLSRSWAVCRKTDGVFSYAARSEVIANLNELVLESLEANHEGDEARIVSFASYKNAKEFIRLLPPEIPNPEVAIEPGDGAISLEWYFGYRKLFAISIGQTKRFAYAGLMGTEKMSGVSQFDETAGKVPDLIVGSVCMIGG